jgi:hypothetical protein
VESEATPGHLKATLVTEAKGPVDVSAIYRGQSMTRSLEQETELAIMPLSGAWSFHRGGVEEPPTSRELGSWTDKWPDFSGTGWYEQGMVIDSAWLGSGRRVYLDLGDVRNIAEVRINGQSVGTRLWPPYRFDITRLLKPGQNRLQIGVTNTLANRYGQGRPGLVEKPVSGLLGPVQLIPAKVLTTEFVWGRR